MLARSLTSIIENRSNTSIVLLLCGSTGVECVAAFIGRAVDVDAVIALGAPRWREVIGVVGRDDGFYAGIYELCENGVKSVEDAGVVVSNGVFVVGNGDDAGRLLATAVDARDYWLS